MAQLRQYRAPRGDLRSGGGIAGKLVYFILPPAFLAAVFVFCAVCPHAGQELAVLSPAPAPTAQAKAPGGSSPAAGAPAVAQTPKPAKPTAPSPSTKQVETAMGTAVTELPPEDPDPNADLEPYVPADGMVNLLASDTPARAGAVDEAFPLSNATDGSVANDAGVAVALPTDDKPAWVEWSPAPGSASAVTTVVIYGGGSRSPAGKLCGGFRVELKLADGSVLKRRFCEAGFALEGYEVWTLPKAADVRALSISALRSNRPLVLRQVQLIGPAAHPAATQDAPQPLQNLNQNTQP